jgi:hypothetical protein
MLITNGLCDCVSVPLISRLSGKRGQTEAFNLFVSFGGRIPDISLGTDVDVVACCSVAAAIVLHAALY